VSAVWEWFTVSGAMPPGVRWLIFAGCTAVGTFLALRARDRRERGDS
jgi:hypothetical protein